ncbi:kinesin motor domain protein [Cooperia oncophora]
MVSAESVRVIARIRPSACDSERITYVLDGKTLCFNSSEQRTYAFEGVFDETIPQEQVYREVANHIVDGCVNGFNGTIFAYGQTGSGKTYTMFGPPQVDNFIVNAEHRGLIPRACDALFTKLCTMTAEKGENFKYEVVCRFVELYNEEFYDLLGDSAAKAHIFVAIQM